MDKELKAAIAFLVEKLECEEDEFVWDKEKQTVNFCFPCSEHEHLLSKAEFLEFVRDCQSLELEGNLIRAGSKTVLLVNPISLKAQFICYYKGKSLSFDLGDGVSIHFVPVSALVGFAASDEGAYGEYHPPDSYPSLEIRYAVGAKKKSPEEEEHLFESFMFELAADADVVFDRSEFQYDLDDNPFEELEEKEFATTLRPLEPFNEGMRLCLAASRISEPELKLLSLYKVLEFFAPIVMAIDSNEALRKKLDSPVVLKPDANYLKSIFDLARSVEQRKKDKEMIRLVLENCVDFVDLSKLLPEPLSKELTHDDKKGQNEHIRLVADALVATRNQVAHAKSNYEPQGNEVSENDLPQLNEFVYSAAIRTIRWYNRLPAHLKLKF